MYYESSAHMPNIDNIPTIKSGENITVPIHPSETFGRGSYMRWEKA